ncbi:carbohydrate-binding module family 50 protein [Peniophora sp. CONT]|nr:carbohydrate-binding module family 50 protein [Peniophora sp. CONT]
MFAAVQLFAAAFALFVAQGVEAQVDNCARNYTVHLGDVCDTIAAQQGVSSYQLESVNNATINADCSNLALGMPLCLALVGKDCQPVHVVESGDTCTSVAEAAGTTVATMVANNPNLGSDCTALYPGLVVCVDSDVVV